MKSIAIALGNMVENMLTAKTGTRWI